LAKHLTDFEVQNKQRLCPNPAVRCNYGMAVKAGGHIIIFFADWGTGTAMFDGQQVTTTPGGVRRVVNEDLFWFVNGNAVEVHFKDAIARAFINPWDSTHYMDIYIEAPARWSSGRSLTGLCWTFNNDLAMMAESWLLLLNSGLEILLVPCSLTLAPKV